MASTLNIAVTGLNDAAARAANATSNIVNAASTNFVPQDVVTLSNSVAGNNLGVRTILVPRRPVGVVIPPPPPPPPVVSIAPVPTTVASITANLPASAPSGFASSPISIPVFDGLGAVQNVSLTFTKTGTNSFTVAIRSPSGASTNGATPTTADFSADVPITFNDTTNPGSLASVSAGGGYSVNGGKVQFDLTYPGAGTQTVTLSLGTLNGSDGLTQFAGTDVTLYSTTQNGSALGAVTQQPNDSSQAFAFNNNVDLAAEIVALSITKTAYGANAKTIKIAGDMQKALVDIET